MSQLSEYEQKAIEKFQESVFNGKWSNEGMVQLIEQCGSFLNLETISHKAKSIGKSYNGVKNYQNVRKIFGVKFVIDNN